LLIVDEDTGIHGFYRLLPPSFRPVAAIAERFIAGFTAAAKCHTIANFVGSTIRGDDRDPTTDPERATRFNKWIFYQNDGWLKGRFYWFPGLFVVDNEATGRAICCFFDCDFSVPGILRGADDIPDPASPMAKTGGRAQVFRVAEFQVRAFEHHGLVMIRRMTRCFCPSEVGFEMRPVTKGFVVRLTAAAERVVVLSRIGFAVLPFTDIPLFVVLDDFFTERDATGDEVRAVGTYGNMIVVRFRFGVFFRLLHSHSFL
jgi:hypothetical protein